MIGVSLTCEVGVDVQEVNENIQIGTVVQNFFHPSEKIWIEQGPGVQAERFYKLWVYKEAYSKAYGDGLSDRITPSGIKSSFGMIPDASKTSWKLFGFGRRAFGAAVALKEGITWFWPLSAYAENFRSERDQKTTLRGLSIAQPTKSASD